MFKKMLFIVLVLVVIFTIFSFVLFNKTSVENVKLVSPYQIWKWRIDPINKEDSGLVAPYQVWKWGINIG